MISYSLISEKSAGLAASAALLLAGAAFAGGEIVTVTTLNDVSDVLSPNTVLDLPGPDGVVSFREALALANNVPGPQTIHFNIPASEFWLMTDRALLRNQSNAFTLSDDGTTVDFTTQTDFTGDTNPGGNEVGIYGTHPSYLGVAGIYISANNCTIIGLDRVMQRGYGVDISGHDNRVISSTISGPLYAGVRITGGFGGTPASGNIVGGTGPGEGNFLSSGNDGVRIDAPADDNIVIGNTLTGTYNGATVRGSIYTTNPNNNRIGGPTPQERNIIAGAGRYGEEGFPDGAQVKVEFANGTIIEGNYIGTTADGTAPQPSQRGPYGVRVVDSSNTIIRNNLISGIRVVGVNHYAGQVFGDGVRVSAVNGPISNTTIENNLIGTDPTGLMPVPNLYGVRVAPFLASQQTTGTDVLSNTIAFNERNGVTVSAPVSGVRIAENSIHDNGQLGIDLMSVGSPGTGVTPNDPGDFDTGGNGLQNFPVLEAAASFGGFTDIDGTLNSTASSQFRIEFFASAPGGCDESGHGEGAMFLGSTDITTNASGDGAFAASLPMSVEAGSVITATATNVTTGNTSEFSACIEVVSPVNPSDLNDDGSVDGLDLGMLLANWSIPVGTPGCGGSTPCASDLNGDGVVDGLDLGMLLSQWTL